MAVRPVVVVRVDFATVEVQVPCVVGIVLRTAPVVAVLATVVQLPVVVVPVPCRRQKQKQVLDVVTSRSKEVTC
jgi:hypothetical protein